MQDFSVCPFRYIYKGRTFCAIAIRERRYTTTEVVPSACATCQARKVMEQIACAHLNLGVEVDQYGGSHEVGIYYASCEKTVERLTEFDKCGEGKCQHWAPADEERAADLRREALQAMRQAEREQSR